MTTTTHSEPTTGFVRRHLIWFVAGFALVLAVAVTAWTQAVAPEHTGRLDPESFGTDGARAVAQVLADQGVELSIVRSADALEAERVGRDTTVVVTGTNRLAGSTTEQLFEHARRGRVVLVEPPEWVTDVAGSSAAAPVEADGLEAGCATYRGLQLRVDGAVGWEGHRSGCFGSDEALVLAHAGQGMVLFGAGDALTNDQILRADNAAIALRLLGGSDRLVWYLPSFDDVPVDETAGLRDLLPDWIVPGLWLGLAAAIALVLWRLRRLGPLSTEPLPVVVRAIETARSRGRMYHQSSDRAHAAATLRRASLRRAAERLNLGRRPDAASVVTAVADHLGRQHSEIARLLDPDSPPPATDHELVGLAHELARIEREVARR